MKNKPFILLAFLASFALAPSGFAQTILSTTTLSAALTSTATTVALTSTSGMLALGSANQVNTCFIVDKELFGVVALIDTTHVQVQRRGSACGALGLSARPTAHASGATVTYANTSTTAGYTAPQLIGKNSPPIGEDYGTCTATNEISLPKVYLQSVDAFDCLNGQWTITNHPGTPTLATAVTIAAGTNAVKATTEITDTGTAAMVTLTVPNGWAPGMTVTFIPGGAFTTTNAGNIRIASTAVVGKALIMTWDGTKWDPSY